MRSAVHKLGRSVAHRVSPLRPSIRFRSCRVVDHHTKCGAALHTTYQMSSPTPMEADVPKPELVAEVEALKKQMAALEVRGTECAVAYVQLAISTVLTR